MNENSAGSVLALQAEVRRLREELASLSGGHLGALPNANQSGKFDRLMELEVLLSKCTPPYLPYSPPKQHFCCP